MPAGSRVRANNVYGTVSDNPLLIGATSFTSLGLNELPAISGQHAVIVLDPKRLFGPDPEIVVVTSHLAMGTTATITRGAYGTAAREHPQGTPWAHVPVGPDDYTAIVTSGTRPSDPYAGQTIFETDTDKFVARIAANSAWMDAIPLGAWITWVPTVTNLSGGTIFAKYSRSGRMVTFRFRYVLAGAGVGTNPQFTLPFAPSADYTGQDPPIGQAFLIDNGTASYPGPVVFSAGSTVDIRCINAAGTYAVMNTISAAVPFTWAVNDALWASGSYETAT